MTTAKELIGRAREIAPAVAARAEEVEQQRAPHSDTIRELIDAELFQILVPTRWGGHGLDLDTHRQIIETLSAACMSTGWIAAFYIGHNYLMIKFPEAAQEEIFADRPFGMIPVAGAPTMTVVREGDGYRVTGRAPFGSGIMHGDWVVVAGSVDGGLPLMLLLPIEDVKVDETWDVVGMAGTGSNDMVVDGAFVPEHRTLSSIGMMSGVTPGTEIHDDPFYSIPMLPFLYCEAMPVFSGGLRGAVNAFESMIQARVTTYGQARAAEQQFAHVSLGQARAHADVAEILVREQIRRTLDYHAGSGFDLAVRLQLKGQSGFLVDHCRSTANELIRHAGAKSFQRAEPLQRFFRDLNMLASHAFWEWDTAREQLGRNRVGLDPTYPLL